MGSIQPLKVRQLLSLEYWSLNFLRYEKGCVFVSLERGPFHNHRPDAIGVTKQMHVMEVEIKRTVSDFKRNKRKIMERHKLEGFQKGPNYFFYLVPEAISRKVMPYVEEGRGLIVLSESFFDLHIVKKAKRLHDDIISTKMLMGMAKDQAGTICKMQEAIDRLNKADMPKPFNIGAYIDQD